MKITSVTFGNMLGRLRGVVRVDPMRDWIVLIVLAMVLLAGIIVWDVWEFTVITNASTQASSQGAGRIPFNLKAFDAIKALIDHRASEQQKYIDGTYTFTDPSK